MFEDEKATALEDHRRPERPTTYPEETIDYGGNKIRVTAREYLPDEQKENYNPHDALIFFQGWGTDVGAPSYAELLHSMANAFGRRVIVIDTKSSKAISNGMEEEAQAGHQYLKEHANHLKNVIVAGYSQGGGRAIYFTKMLQGYGMNPEMLLLMAPVGLSEQDPAQGVSLFFKDVLHTIPSILTARSTIQSPHEPSRMGKAWRAGLAGTDILTANIRDKIRQRGQYTPLLHTEIADMARLHPYLDRVSIPVLLAQGEGDLVLGPVGDLDHSQMAGQDPKGLVAKEMKRLFPNSPLTTRILLRKSGTHAAPLLRPTQLAEAAAGWYQHHNKLGHIQRI